MSTHVLLRFRDLNLSDGETISKHQEIIEVKGSTWWGWWSKYGEKAPLSVFAHISSGSDIFFYDSGQGLFFKAIFSEYKADAGKKIPTPSKELTPSYYNDKQAKLWIKITALEPIDSAQILGLYAYERMDDLFEDSLDVYTEFHNKRVASVRELRHQERTMWLIKIADESADSHEIVLCQKGHFNPEHFHSSYIQTKGSKLLWLSDLHFSEVAEGHRFPLVSTEYKHSLYEALIKCIDHVVPEGERKIEGLVISGDLTSRALESEFKSASKLIRDICSKYSINDFNTGVIPGNHDFEFELETDHGSGYELGPVSEESRTNYSNFYKDLFKSAPNKHYSIGRRFLFCMSKPVEMVYINSTYIQQVRGAYQGHAYVGDEQLTYIAEKMGWVKGKKIDNITRIAVMHHHLIPVNYSDEPKKNGRYSTILDGERLAKWLTEYQVDYLLHGHMHQNFYAQLTRPIHTNSSISDGNKVHKINIISLGSSGVKLDHTPENSKGNYACLIDFSEDKPCFEFYKLSDEGNGPSGPELKVKGIE